MTKSCAICDASTTFFTRRKIANEEFICEDCFKQAKTLTNKQIIRLNKVTSDEIRQSIKDSVGEEVMNFKPTKLIGATIQFDDVNKKMLIPGSFSNQDVFNYRDVVGYELIEDGNTLTSGGLGRAVVGGVLFGGAGAVVGAVTGKKKNREFCTNLKIKLTVNDMDQPVVYITFIHEKTKTSSTVYGSAYNNAQECLSVLQLICDQQEVDSIKSSNGSADEIMKYKNLLDAGAITKEEYDSKKKELLGL